MSVIKRSDNGKSAEAYDIDELKNNWNHWVRTGEILFTPNMKKSRRIVKKMSKKSLINKKALRYIIANSNLCKHAIRELELAGYSKEEDGPNKWMREQVIEAVALFSSHGNSGFSAPFEINLVKKLCSFDIISPLRFDDGEWGK